ncbi:MAG: Crp/Fnr family transcriptional regulator [Fusobacteriaceae bacterium]
MTKYEKLEEIKFFQLFTLEELKKIIEEKNIRLKKYSEEDYAYFQGDSIEEVSFIIKGQFKGEKILENGKVVEIERFGKGTLIASAFIYAEFNLLPVDLLALEDSEIISIERENFFRLLMSNSFAMRNFLKISSQKSQVISNRFTEINQTIGDKIDNYIRDNSKDSQIKFDLSLKELAEKFGVERPSLSRVLSKYVKDGKLLRLEKNSYKILKF